MIIDFRNNPTDISPVVINDHVVEAVHQFKYLGNVIDEKLTFEAHVDDLCKKAHQCMFYLWKRCSFNVDSTFPYLVPYVLIKNHKCTLFSISEVKWQP